MRGWRIRKTYFCGLAVVVLAAKLLSEKTGAPRVRAGEGVEGFM